MHSEEIMELQRAIQEQVEVAKAQTEAELQRLSIETGRNDELRKSRELEEAKLKLLSDIYTCVEATNQILIDEVLPTMIRKEYILRGILETQRLIIMHFLSDATEAEEIKRLNDLLKLIAKHEVNIVSSRDTVIEGNING